MGQHMTFAGKKNRTSESGYRSQIHLYQAQNCHGCPLRGLCQKAKGNRRIEVNHTLQTYKRKARERLTSEEGLQHRSRRPIEPEAVFGQMKANKHYKRFRHFGKDKIKMDFAIFAIAFNMGKMWNYSQKQRNTAIISAKNQDMPLLVLVLDKKSAMPSEIDCRWEAQIITMTARAA
jgi:hypothetical protein